VINQVWRAVNELKRVVNRVKWGINEVTTNEEVLKVFEVVTSSGQLWSKSDKEIQ
jgi:hypothetical protein